MKDNFLIFNKDSRFLYEVKDKTIDYVITSPPFNINHGYKTYPDTLDFKDFDDLFSNVIKSISRVLKDDGFFIIDIADIIVMDKNIIRGAEYVKEKAQSANLFLLSSLPYIAIEGTNINMKSCISRSDIDEKFHSSCEQVLLFGKKLSQLESAKNFRIKPSYRYSELHDSAFWPEDLISDLIAPFVMKDKILLDPFMGSGTIGRKTIEEGGCFIGYDVDKDMLKTYGWL